MSDPLQTVRLWDGPAPGARGEQPQDIPKLTIYPAHPAAATGAAMVVCPGGGYGGLAAHEGQDYALFLAEQGIMSFVLQYRLGTHGYRHPCMWQDAARALRTVRARAGEWMVNPQQIGIMGSSAGGHLAATLLTRFDAGDAQAADPIERVSCRPDLGVLCYPVVNLVEHAHGGSRDNLLGPNAPAERCRELSPDLNVSPRTPPCFIWHTWEDEAVPAENALVLAAALRQHGVAFDLHVYQKGRHGIGLADRPPFTRAHPWSRDLVYWLKEYRFTA